MTGIKAVSYTHLKYPALYQTGILYKKEYIVDSKRIMRKSALKYSEGMSCLLYTSISFTIKL